MPPLETRIFRWSSPSSSGPLWKSASRMANSARVSPCRAMSASACRATAACARERTTQSLSAPASPRGEALSPGDRRARPGTRGDGASARGLISALRYRRWPAAQWPPGARERAPASLAGSRSRSSPRRLGLAVGEQRHEGRGEERVREQVALAHVAAELTQSPELRLGLDSL